MFLLLNILGFVSIYIGPLYLSKQKNLFVKYRQLWLQYIRDIGPGRQELIRGGAGDQSVILLVYAVSPMNRR